MLAVSDEEQIRQRLKLMLRAERAFGAPGVIDAAIEQAVDVPVDVRPAAASEVRTPIGNRPVATAAMPTTPAEVLFETPASEAAPVLAFGPNRPPYDTPPLAREKKLALLQAMDADEVKVCTKCDLCKTRTNTVFGEGDADAQLMFIGEGPGENEDLQGRPFVGRAGELLNKMINGMGLRREQVFIANIVKCRPPNNRVPAPDEVASCTPYLERQIETIRPRVIVTLGAPSSQYMLQSKMTMGKLRGTFHDWRGIKLMPTYHPAYLLRNYTDATRAAVWSDLQQVMKELGLVRERKIGGGN